MPVNEQVARFLRHLALSDAFRRPRPQDRLYQIVPWEEPVVDLTRVFARQFRHRDQAPLRALDAIQLASAALAQAETTALALTLSLVTADRHLRQIALDAGFAVINPERVS